MQLPARLRDTANHLNDPEPPRHDISSVSDSRISIAITLRTLFGRGEGGGGAEGGGGGRDVGLELELVL